MTERVTPSGPPRSRVARNRVAAGIFADNPDWMDSGDCASTDPELFFPEKGGTVRQPKRVCAGCPVKDECLEYALDNGETHGIWGGYTAMERRPMRRERAA